MKLKGVRFPEGTLFSFGAKIVIGILISFGQSDAAQNWSLFTSMAYNNGKYIYDQTSTNYYLNSGIRYRASRWSFSASLPFILQDSPVFEQGINAQSKEDETMHGMDNFSGGIGDIYFYGSYRLIQRRSSLPSLSITAQVKVPTGNELTLFSTGASDYGIGLALNKKLGRFNAFADASYLNLGDPQEINYNDPFGFGIGIGRFFRNGKLSASLYYKSYTEIISDVDPPGQASLGLFARLSPATIVSFFIGRGFSVSSPDVVFTTGIDWKL
ncbi:MAG: DUF3187 family protein [Calditrichaeota bacterium]|nr:MAG: DUF3187 family protein [Calditrichota bacterium]